MKVGLLGRDTVNREEKAMMEKLEEASKNATAYKEEVERSKAQLLAVEGQLKKKDEQLEKNEKSLRKALAQVKRGAELLEEAQDKIRRLESDLAKLRGDLKATSTKLAKLEEKQKDGEYLDDAFYQTECFISFTKDFSDEGFRFALTKARKMWLELDLGPLKLTYARVWTTMYDGMLGSEDAVKSISYQA